MQTYTYFKMNFLVLTVLNSQKISKIEILIYHTHSFPYYYHFMFYYYGTFIIINKPVSIYTY